MKKRIVLFAVMSLLAVMSVSAQSIVPVEFNVCEGGPVGGGGQPGGCNNGHPRGPITPPSAGLDDHTLYIYGEHPAYTLYLVDTSGDEPDVVYQVSVPANVGTIYLPTTLVGTFELQLYGGGEYYFYSEIELE